MMQTRGVRSLMMLLCPLLLLVSCDYEGPDAVWNPDYELGTAPVIEQVEPAGSAVAGVPEIVLHGQNFSENAVSNIVYFGNVRVDVKQATATELIVYRPNLQAEGFAIKVVKEGSVLYGEYSPYTVDPIGGLYVEIKNMGKANAIAFDAAGTLLVHVDKKEVYKILPNKDLELVLGNTQPRTVYDMKLGSDGYLYCSRDRNYLNRVPYAGGEWENFCNGAPGNLKYFDFDINENIYSGGLNSGLILLLPEGTASSLGLFTEHDIRSVRVFNNAVYVAAIYTGTDSAEPAAGIWKVPITGADGSVSAPELILDWANTGDYVNAVFSDINFDTDGNMYIGTNGGPDNLLDPMLQLTSEGDLDVFYKGGLLTAPIFDLVWGNDNALYYLRPTGDINLYEIHRLQMVIGGAPDFGRQ